MQSYQELQYYKNIPGDTSQGIVGLLKPISSGKFVQTIFTLDQPLPQNCATQFFFVKDEPLNSLVIFKVPREVNTIADHEYKVAKDMEELTCCLPHFNRVYEIKRGIKCNISRKNKKFFNPFDIDVPPRHVRDILLIEYIPSTLTLLDFIRQTEFNHNSYQQIHQLIIALIIAQQEKEFTHYDLHLENVLIRKCLKRTFFLYKFLYEGATITRLVYTDGYFPVLFDYGFAYSKGLKGTSFNNSLFFTNKGYTPFMFDDVNDFKTIMVRLAYLKTCPEELKKLVVNIGNKLFLRCDETKTNLNRVTGWFKTTIPSIARVIYKKMEPLVEVIPGYENSFIYIEMDNILDLFGILIKLPVTHTNFNMRILDQVVEDFLVEWMKLDLWFMELDEKLNIFKKVLETIDELIMEENCEKVDYDKIQNSFKLRLFDILDGFGDYADIQNINYGKMLSSTIEMSNFIEYILYTEIQIYKKIFNYTLNGWTLFNLIEDIIMDKNPYTFQKDDHIVLFDCMEKITTSFNIEDEVVNTLNSSSELSQQINILLNTL